MYSWLTLVSSVLLVQCISHDSLEVPVEVVAPYHLYGSGFNRLFCPTCNTESVFSYMYRALSTSITSPIVFLAVTFILQGCLPGFWTISGRWSLDNFDHPSSGTCCYLVVGTHPNVLGWMLYSTLFWTGCLATQQSTDFFFACFLSVLATHPTLVGCIVIQFISSWYYESCTSHYDLADFTLSG